LLLLLLCLGLSTQVHELAFSLWSTQMESPAHHKFLLLPTPQPPALLPTSTAAQPAGHAAGSSRSSGDAVRSGFMRQQQQQRRLLCAEDQLQALCGMRVAGTDTCEWPYMQ
jgi:hypothetical protein